MPHDDRVLLNPSPKPTWQWTIHTKVTHVQWQYIYKWVQIFQCHGTNLYKFHIVCQMVQKPKRYMTQQQEPWQLTYFLEQKKTNSEGPGHAP